MKLIALLAAVTVTGTVASCTIIPPKMQLTGERTQLEKQIIGDYRELERDSWAVSNIRTNVARESGTVSSDPDTAGAERIRSMNGGRIARYKAEKSVGEGLDGMLKYRPVETYEKNRTLRDELERVIVTENNARRSIIRNSAKRSGGSEKDEAARFAREQQSRAAADELIETSAGVWERKR